MVGLLLLENILQQKKRPYNDEALCFLGGKRRKDGPRQPAKDTKSKEKFLEKQFM